MRVAQDIAPLVLVGAFLAIFWRRARARGQGVQEYLHERNRRTFTTLLPGWWKRHVAFAAAAWLALWVLSGFRLILLVALPIIVAWVPLGTLAIRSHLRRR